MDISAVQRAHCIGVGGIGVSAMAKLLRAQGASVSGSDLHDSAIMKELKERDIRVWVGSHPEYLGRDVELVVYSDAVPDTDEELIRVRHLGAREYTYFEFLGEVSGGKNLVAVTGTHGKSTTTALIGHMLVQAGVDPTVVVGSKVPSLKAGNLQIGASDVFVAEACEHRAHMLSLAPKVAVVTNVEFDHPDYYQDLAHVVQKMTEFCDKIPNDGLIVWNAEDPASRTMIEATSSAAPRVSVGEGGDLSMTIEEGEGVQTLSISFKGEELGQIHLRLPGRYNAMNALCAVAVGLHLKLEFSTIAAGIESFPGLWRRFEKIGVFNGAPVISDYAHHPTALINLLKGTRQFYPSRRIVLCFQPHQGARTRGLFDEFVASMDDADVIVLPEIFGVEGRNDGDTISSADLVDAMTQRDSSRPMFFAKDLDAAGARLSEIVQEGDVLLMVGAGTIDAFARTFVLPKS